MAKIVKKGKKKRQNKQTSERWKKYAISGDTVTKKSRCCPRCGPGIFMAENKDRLFCGRCHYAEFKKQ